MSATAEVSEDKGSHIWTLLPTFDPAIDNVKEYIEKVKFIDQICPKKDRPMLAPRLAMLCRGTAWGQVKNLQSGELTDPENGVKNLLAALSSWEESTEIKTYEQFERAVYKTVQKSDESSMSYVNRLQVAMDELGAKSLKEFHAFLLLRQSALSPEDKKKVLTMTNGDMDTKKIEQAMRTLATSILSPNDVKKKVYPTNFVEPESSYVAMESDPSASYGGSAYFVDDDEVDQEYLDQLASQGDADALNVVSFEQDLEDMFQNVPDLHQALISYQEARTKILERKKSRGFWPSTTGKGKSKSYGKFAAKGKSYGKGNLLMRISRTHCKACGEKGHWKAECPNKPVTTTDAANFVAHQTFHVVNSNAESEQVIFEGEEFDEARKTTESGLWGKLGIGKIFNKIGMGIMKGVKHVCHAIQSLPMACIRVPVRPSSPHVPFADAYSLHHLIPEVQKFFQQRLKPRTQKPSPEFDCFHNQLHLGAIADEGLAILDTGASRSVIGADLWPGVWKSLPAKVQSHVQEIPSKVGFRFGNNQITYSFKQIRIPIFSGRKRIWIVIEVVPKATPFLISIQALKALGAMIDLSNNQCFLQKINRELSLQESDNGLYVIKMAELCVGTEENAMTINSLPAVEVPSQISPPPGLSTAAPLSHAGDPARCHEGDPIDRRSSDGVIAHASDHLDEPDRGESTGPSDLRAACGLPVEPLGPCECPEGQDRRVVPDAAGKSITEEVKGIHWNKAIKSWRPIGSVMGAGGGGRDDCSPEQLTAKDESAEIYLNTISCSPGSTEHYGKGSGKSTGVDGTGHRKLGKQEGVLGQNPQWQTLCDGVRGVPTVCGVDQSPSGDSKSSNAGLHHVRPRQRGHGASSTEGPPLRSNKQKISMFLESAYEMKLMHSCRHHMPQNDTPGIDLLEIYASPQSRLTDEVIKKGGTAKRFTLQDGDLSTFEGQIKLLRKVFMWKPRHIWMAPECAPWSPWNRFNQMRSPDAFCRIQEQQEFSKDQLAFCSLLCRVQQDRGDHFHLENPAPSGMWHQEEMDETCRRTKPAFFDQCQFGLRHPTMHEPMQKRTRVQTSSEEMFQSLDSRFCKHDHEHAQIAGNCHYQGKSIRVSRFAAFYPRVLAKKLAEILMRPVHDHVNVPALVRPHECFPVRSLEAPDSPDESASKRARVEDSPAPVQPSKGRKRALVESDPIKLDDPAWKALFDRYRIELPKSGVVEWNGPSNPEVQAIQKLCPDMNIQAVMAGKGREKYMIHSDALPFRKTIIMNRMSYDIMDLGVEELSGMSKNNQCRKARPAHIMLCLFGRPQDASDIRVSEPVESKPLEERDQPGENASPRADEMRPATTSRDLTEMSGNAPADQQLPANSWTSAAVSVSGPKFMKLSEQRKSFIRKLHHNLGHPTAERLSKHLQELGAEEQLVQGALDYLCASCAERKPPSLNPTGAVKETRDFNQRLYIDGFDWKGSTGYQGYVVHIIDEATQFHLGRRTVRDGIQARKVFDECWSSWAGTPSEMVMDCGGEFVAEPWKEFLQQENIKPILTAAPWQRGRIERHGGIIKEMLHRIDSSQPIHNEAEFERALHQAFRAKNSMSTVCGYSPEQAVLGKATKLPASIISDESTPAHLQADSGEGPEADRFRSSLELRVLARKAFVDSDNSQAIRRAMLRKSRGEVTEWQCGQPCMFWDKRRSPNMLEKGKWCGPAQIVLVESKTIAWVTHMNRLLRCARDNLRPVSLREFERHASFNQHIDAQQAQHLANQLRRRLHERSGMFQFSDLSDVPPEPNVPLPDSHGNQPEEEPSRRGSVEMIPPVAPEEIAIPDISEQAWESDSLPSPSSFAPETPNGDNVSSNEGINNNGEPNMGDSNEEGLAGPTNVVYNAFFTESNVPGPAILSDEDTLWDEVEEDPRPYCEYEFEVPQQQIQRFLANPKMHTSFLATAARRAKAEVKYADLSNAEKELFKQAKSREMNCWLETSSVVSSSGWTVQNFDITTAFLRGKSDGRQLAMEPVSEMKDLLKMRDSEVLMLDGNAYGRVDAPLLFYKEFRSQLEKVGFEAHPLDNCLYLLKNREDPESLDGILGTHVDDGIGGGNENYEKALQQLQRVLPFGQREYRKFRFTGLDIEQLPDNSICVSQEEYIHKIDPISIPKQRRNQKNELASPAEVHELRGLCGSLQYAAVHSRPDLAAKVAFIQKSICKATVSTLLDANRVLVEAKQTADTRIMVRPIPLHKVTFASFGDASFASASQMKAQQGLFIVACTPELAANKSSEISPMSWNSKQIGRVVRSTLSAEAYAMSSSLDKLTWLRCLWHYILSPTFKWQYPEKSLQSCLKALLITDCKSLYDLVTKLAVPNCEEWRTTVEVMLIKQQAEGHSVCRWISTAIMLADSLTKPMDASFLRTVLRLGKFRIFDENQTLQNNSRRKIAEKWVSLPSAALHDGDVPSMGAHPKEKETSVNFPHDDH
eukprot:s1582_g15.t1